MMEGVMGRTDGEARERERRNRVVGYGSLVGVERERENSAGGMIRRVCGDGRREKGTSCGFITLCSAGLAFPTPYFPP
jgi:hypothetical protein